MAGRGRGMSFSVDQLGLMPGEMLPGPVLQPPPLFPPLEYAPAQASARPAHMAFRTALVNHLRATGVFVALDSRPQGLAISVATTPTDTPSEAPLSVDWALFPSELSPLTRSNLKRPAPSSVKRPAKHVTLLLDELEKKEVKEEDDDEGKGGGADNSAKRKEGEGEEGGGNEAEEEDGGEWEDADEEMDDGTDYNQNYFDNGEGYLDDSDDNIDDGPTY